MTNHRLVQWYTYPKGQTMYTKDKDSTTLEVDNKVSIKLDKYGKLTITDDNKKSVIDLELLDMDALLAQAKVGREYKHRKATLEFYRASNYHAQQIANGNLGDSISYVCVVDKQGRYGAPNAKDWFSDNVREVKPGTFLLHLTWQEARAMFIECGLTEIHPETETANVEQALADGKAARQALLDAEQARRAAKAAEEAAKPLPFVEPRLLKFPELPRNHPRNRVITNRN